jgi:CO dehydrogenase/acetyl-CoA synthase beta subunit
LNDNPLVDEIRREENDEEEEEEEEEGKEGSKMITLDGHLTRPVVWD